MPSEIQARIIEAVKDAMRARHKQRLGVLRLITASFKSIEVDERIILTDARVLAILDKMVKQRRDSVTQFKAAGRDDLVAQECFEIDVIQEYLPKALDAVAIGRIVDAAIAQTDATSMQDMGRLMGVIRPQVQGRADMSSVSTLVKQRLQ